MNERPNSNTNEDIVLDQYSYKTLHKLIKSGMWKMYCSRDFQIVGVEWSDELRRMIGYTNEQDFPNRFEAWSDLLHPEDKGRVLGEIDPVLRDVTGNKIFDQDYRLYTKNQGYSWFRASADVARREDGTPYCLFGIFVDVTEQKEHDKLEKARDEALKKADAELVWRDTLADIMTRNLDSVYVILNKKNRESVYVSPSIEQYSQSI